MTNTTTSISVSDGIIADLHKMALSEFDSRYAELFYDCETGEVSECLHASRNSWTESDNDGEIKITAGVGGIEVDGRFFRPEEYEHDFENCFDELASGMPTPAGYDPDRDCLSEFYEREDIVRYLHDGRTTPDEEKDRDMLREMWLPVIEEAFGEAFRLRHKYLVAVFGMEFSVEHSAEDFYDEDHDIEAIVLDYEGYDFGEAVKAFARAVEKYESDWCVFGDGELSVITVRHKVIRLVEWDDDSDWTDDHYKTRGSFDNLPDEATNRVRDFYKSAYGNCLFATRCGYEATDEYHERLDCFGFSGSER